MGREKNCKLTAVPGLPFLGHSLAHSQTRPHLIPQGSSLQLAGALCEQAPCHLLVPTQTAVTCLRVNRKFYSIFPVRFIQSRGKAR